MSLDFRPPMIPSADHFTALTREYGIFRYPSASYSIASASWTVINSEFNFLIKKFFAPTALKAEIFLPPYASGAFQGVEVGLRISGADYRLLRYHYDEGGSRTNLSGFGRIAAGLAPGTYTVSVVWRRFTGSGSVTIDAESLVVASVREIP